MSFHPDTKNAAGSFSCGNVIASALHTTVR